MTAAPRFASQTAAQRQAKYSSSLQRQGLERITLVGAAATVELLRDLSRDHNEPMVRVPEMGGLVARCELTSRTAQG